MKKLATGALATTESELREGQALSVLPLKIYLRDNLVRSAAIWGACPEDESKLFLTEMKGPRLEDSSLFLWRMG